jgi:hypothetical protein
VSLRRALRVATAHLRGRRRIARAAAREVGRLWSRVDRGNIARSWQAQLPEAEAVVTAAQAFAAGAAGAYLAELLDAYGLPGDAAGTVRATALAGVASDGRPLDSLLYQPAIRALQTIADGAFLDEAMGRGLLTADLIAHTQVGDAGRVADGVQLAAQKHVSGYVRQLVLPSCSRCIILAGKFYEWNTGFLRHPGCDCVHIPAPEDAAGDITTDPMATFNALSPAEQDKVFTIAGAQAIRDGADISQVVNARRGANGLSPAGARITTAEVKILRGGRNRGRLQPVDAFGVPTLITTEGTTVRGFAGRRLGAREDAFRRSGARYRSARPPRLMPEEIYRIAGDNRDEALRLLRRNGYLI